MEYGDWLVEFDKYHRAYALGEISVAEAHEGIAHLRSMLDQVPANRLDWGQSELASFENELTSTTRERAGRAFDAYRRGMSAKGSLQERFDAAERAIEELGSIAEETDDRDEKWQITGPASALYSHMMVIRDRMIRNAGV